MILRVSSFLPALLLALTLPRLVAGADPVLPKDGSCPGGYHTEGRYCVGNRDDSPAAIVKDGSCPGGYHTEGRYCVGNRNDPPAAIVKDGSCPGGYHTEGRYCVGNRR